MFVGGKDQQELEQGRHDADLAVRQERPQAGAECRDEHDVNGVGCGHRLRTDVQGDGEDAAEPDREASPPAVGLPGRVQGRRDQVFLRRRVGTQPHRRTQVLRGHSRGAGLPLGWRNAHRPQRDLHQPWLRQVGRRFARVVRRGGQRRHHHALYPLRLGQPGTRVLQRRRAAPGVDLVQELPGVQVRCWRVDRRGRHPRAGGDVPANDADVAAAADGGGGAGGARVLHWPQRIRSARRGGPCAAARRRQWGGDRRRGQGHSPCHQRNPSSCPPQRTGGLPAPGART
mmetsp:Transcript_3661/g.12917  ORF Transcript_3661/g.12917 Transcript_3661/m.12917 type:complete len:286 (+) Transcript_3661:1066-1923(+)